MSVGDLENVLGGFADATPRGSRPLRSFTVCIGFNLPEPSSSVLLLVGFYTLARRKQ